MFNELRSEVIVRFVDIDGTVDHHYLNLLNVIPTLALIIESSTLIMIKVYSVYIFVSCVT